MNSHSIGVLDSGVGGFSTCLELTNTLPQESIIYYGDLLHMPYGEKTDQYLIERLILICTHLQALNCKAIIFACNTASSIYLRYPESFHTITIPIFNVIDATISYLKQQNIKQDIFTVLATQATINSNIYYNKLIKEFPQKHINSIAATEWASLVETESIDSEAIKHSIEKYLPQIPNTPTNTIILACTHFYYLQEVLENYLSQAMVINTSVPVIKQVSLYLEQNQIFSNTLPIYRILASKNTKIFENMAKNTFNDKIFIELCNI